MSTETKPAEWCARAAEAIFLSEDGIMPGHVLNEPASQSKIADIAAIIAKHAPAQGVNERLLSASRGMRDQIEERTHPHHDKRECSFVGNVVCSAAQLEALSNAIAAAEAALSK